MTTLTIIIQWMLLFGLTYCYFKLTKHPKPKGKKSNTLPEKSPTILGNSHFSMYPMVPPSTTEYTHVKPKEIHPSFEKEELIVSLEMEEVWSHNIDDLIDLDEEAEELREIFEANDPLLAEGIPCEQFCMSFKDPKQALYISSVIDARFEQASLMQGDLPEPIRAKQEEHKKIESFDINNSNHYL